MWDGSVKLARDIVVGDELVGDDGTVRSVAHTFTGEDDMFTVRQTRGMDYTVNSKHTLLFRLSGCGPKRIVGISGRNGGGWGTRFFADGCVRQRNFDTYEEATRFWELCTLDVELTVDEYLRVSDTHKKKLVAWKSAGVDWDAVDVPISPYVLGAWLGDGYSNGSAISGVDAEVIEAVADWCDENGCELAHCGALAFNVRGTGNGRTPAVGHGSCDTCTGCKRRRFDPCDKPRLAVMGPAPRPAPTATNPFRAALMRYDLIDNKHIPMDYMRNSRANRLELLAGLMDTDGNVCHGGKCLRFIQSNLALTEQVATLARSLGLRTTVNARQPAHDSITIAGVTRAANKPYKTQYIVNISGAVDAIPTKIPRKKCVASESGRDTMTTGFSVEPAGRGQYFGWKVDGPNNRFVLEDFTVVRNCDQYVPSVPVCLPLC